jgi:membrane protease YdiL (CAAX protease family)
LPLGSPVCTIPLIIYVSRKSGIPINWTITLPQIHHILLLVLLGVSTVIITQPFIYPIEYFSNLIEGRFKFIELVVPKFNLLIVINFILRVFIGPIFEEIFWRRQIFGLLLNKYSPVISIVLSSALFACAHLRMYYIGALFIWGLLFCFVYYKSNSLELSILLHSITNGFIFFVKPAFIDFNEIQFFKYIMIIVISAIVIYLVISYFGRHPAVKKVGGSVIQDTI